MRSLASLPLVLGLFGVSVGCFLEPPPLPGLDDIGEDGSSGDSGEGDGTGSDSSGTDSDGTGSDGTGSDGTGSDGSGSDGSDGTDSSPPPECGNMQVEDGEACDDGPTPPLAPGACKPDCSGPIETREILTSYAISDGNFGPNPVAYADSLCVPGYQAMFAFETVRRGTTDPWQSVGAIDWPIQPYTHYVDAVGNTVWITDDVALLGVRDGQHVDFENPIYQALCDPLCLIRNWVTGIKPDGTTASADNCNGWTDATDVYESSYASFVTGEMDTGTVGCSYGDLFTVSYRFACVQQ